MLHGALHNGDVCNLMSSCLDVVQVQCREFLEGQVARMKPSGQLRDTVMSVGCGSRPDEVAQVGPTRLRKSRSISGAPRASCMFGARPAHFLAGWGGPTSSAESGRDTVSSPGAHGPQPCTSGRPAARPTASAVAVTIHVASGTPRLRGPRGSARRGAPRSTTRATRRRCTA